MNLGILSNIVATVKSDPPPCPSYFCCCYFACLLICVVIYLDLPGLSCVIHFLWDVWPLMALFSWFLFLFLFFFFFNSGFLEVVSVSTQCSGHPILVRDYIQTYQTNMASTYYQWICMWIHKYIPGLDSLQVCTSCVSLVHVHRLLIKQGCVNSCILLERAHQLQSARIFETLVKCLYDSVFLSSHYIFLSHGFFTFVFAQPGLQSQISRTPGFPHLLGSQITAPRGMDYFTFFKSSQSSSSKTAGYSQPTLWCENYHTEWWEEEREQSLGSMPGIFMVISWSSIVFS